MGDKRSLPRRALLTRGALFVVGALGLGAAGKTLTEREPSSGALAMQVRGANWQSTYPNRARGVLPEAGQRSSVYGELFSTEEEKVGEFYASSFQFGAPFGASELAAGAMETHQFNFRDGTIVGIGTLADLNGSASVHAIIGGTGRYAGASGSYTARQRPVQMGGDGTAEFDFQIILRSA